MTEPRTRPRPVTLGVLVGLPVLLLGLPAAWHVAQPHVPAGSPAWSSPHAHGARVARGSQVEISGTARRTLRPGGSSGINLAFTNRSSSPVTLRHVRVTITGVSAPEADAQHPCTRADFRVRPMQAAALVVPGAAPTDLVRLAVPSWRWPHLEMRNRPSNQDGCKGARLTLGYVGYQVFG